MFVIKDLITGMYIKNFNIKEDSLDFDTRVEFAFNFNDSGNYYDFLKIKKEKYSYGMFTKVEII